MSSFLLYVKQPFACARKTILKRGGFPSSSGALKTLENLSMPDYVKPKRKFGPFVTENCVFFNHQVGDTFSAGESFGSVESVKAASSVYAPVDCEVVEVNEKLNDEPSTINESAEGDGWIMKVKVTDPGQFGTVHVQTSPHALCTKSLANLVAACVCQPSRPPRHACIDLVPTVSLQMASWTQLLTRSTARKAVVIKSLVVASAPSHSSRDPHRHGC